MTKCTRTIIPGRIESWDRGYDVKTQYDKPEDPPSKDATVMITVNNDLNFDYDPTSDSYTSWLQEDDPNPTRLNAAASSLATAC